VRTCLGLLLERHKNEKADIEIGTFFELSYSILYFSQTRKKSNMCKREASKVNGERTFRPEGHIPPGMRTSKSFLIRNAIYVPKKKLPQAIKIKYNLLN
jgi:hypothetical protein